MAGYRSLRRTALLAVYCCLFATRGQTAQAEPTPSIDAPSPNILFVLSDDQRFDTLGCAGHPILKTPHLDALARDGVRFTNMFVTTSICAASRATIFTGLYERTHRFTFGTPPISAADAAASYPAGLKRAGYRTGFVGKFGVQIAPGRQKEMFDYFKPLGRGPYFKKRSDGSKRHVSQIAGDYAIEFLRDQKPGKPFCLSLSFNAPHAEDGDKKNHFPWPKAVDGLYRDVTIPAPRLAEPSVFESQPAFLKKSMNRSRWFWRWDTLEKYQKNIKGYYRMISGVDHVVGRLLAELEEQKLADNTVVIFTSDNGYYAAQRGFAGKWSHYEESLRVPLIVYDPRLPKDRRGKTSERICLNVDLAPTILSIAGVKIPDAYQGRNLSPLVDGRPPKDWRDDFFCEHLFNHPAIPKWEGVRGERWVYARYFEQKPAFEFLHDLKQDRNQMKNFATDPQHADSLAKMRVRCDELRDHYGGPYRPHPKRKK